MTWRNPLGPVVDLNAAPQTGYLADHAGSYHTTRVSQDGKTLHVAFIWKVEDPVMNKRYGRLLDDHTQRYNLYYFKVDLPSGKAYNRRGEALAIPIKKKSADELCRVWDTQERVAAVGPSIYLDHKDHPYFLLPVSDQTPYKCQFYFVRFADGDWKKTPIARTSHPFNSCLLDRDKDGSFMAYLITGKGESVSDQNMDRYGWGDRVELWTSDKNGENWKLQKDLTPEATLRYQNIQFVRDPRRGISGDLLLFYGWKGGRSGGPGKGFLLDMRK